ncbi:MAG: ATP-binding protein, partial [Kangiella sp.]|nr:ATP-binding protein [Kangiella sp.]
NLLDNACKWAKQQVKVSASQNGLKTSICIEDDGPGIAEEVRLAVLTRGKRLDESVDGQGIGMSVVKEIVDAYRGDIDIGTSDLGGALIKLVF